MKNKINFYSYPLLYALFMAISGFIISNFFHVNYAEPVYVQKKLPFLIIAALVVSVCVWLKRDSIKPKWEKDGRLALYLVYMIPLFLVIIYFWISKGNFSISFLIPFITTFFVGLGEELVMRRVLFVGLLNEKGFWKALFISSIIFGILHGISIFSGMPVNQALMQIGMTFMAGLFLGMMYEYTKKIHFVILQHWLWDYLILSGVAKENKVIGLVVIGMIILQVVLTIILMIRKYKKMKETYVE
ncbi:CPBP family intramembrane glutamic endopeptidase [Corynebacterium pseudotuberculosis]|nr:CPBP family intramembrane glutamic endopeptidase [Corynebacterium pseudotuberculosis]APG82124.1 CAAX amino terminal protease [Corynebacterium pseudotuberculosis]ASA48279.2 CPBP family intramembrane metalloprotease [Corynebacterium pseudotuberculosis Cp162]WFP67788.1 CPBP family intramembrane metalloprotease [Corynebacterium pseudotuberculosis]